MTTTDTPTGTDATTAAVVLEPSWGSGPAEWTTSVNVEEIHHRMRDTSKPGEAKAAWAIAAQHAHDDPRIAEWAEGQLERLTRVRHSDDQEMGGLIEAIILAVKNCPQPIRERLVEQIGECVSGHESQKGMRRAAIQFLGRQKESKTAAQFILSGFNDGDGDVVCDAIEAAIAHPSWSAPVAELLSIVYARADRGVYGVGSGTVKEKLIRSFARLAEHGAEDNPTLQAAVRAKAIATASLGLTDRDGRVSSASRDVIKKLWPQ